MVDLYKPYVDELHNLPRDGRFLLVSNHTQTSPEPFLIFYLVRRGRGASETARELMRHNQPILAFRGGGRGIPSSKARNNPALATSSA